MKFRQPTTSGSIVYKRLACAQSGKMTLHVLKEIVGILQAGTLQVVYIYECNRCEQRRAVGSGEVE